VDGIVFTDKQWLNITRTSALSLGSLDDGDVDTFTSFNSGVAQSGSAALDLDGIASLRIRIDARLSTDDRAVYFDDIAVVGDAQTADNFGSYMFLTLPADSYTEADRAVNADPDGDGFDNLLEYAFTSHPIVPTQEFGTAPNQVPIEPEVWTSTDGFVFCKFRIPGGHVEGDVDFGYVVNDVNVRPQIAFDSFDELDGWNDGTLGVNYFTQVGPFEESTDGSGSVFVTCKTIQPEVDNHDKLFVRVRVGLRYPPYLKGVVSECPL
jgi:hypothetical protein